MLLYGSMVVYLFAVIGVGLFVSSLAKTQQQAILGAFVFMVPGDVPFGLCQPDREHARLAAIRHAGQPDPLLHRDREGHLSEGRAAASVVLANLWPMAVIAVVTLSSAAWLFRHRME